MSNDAEYIIYCFFLLSAKYSKEGGGPYLENTRLIFLFRRFALKFFVSCLNYYEMVDLSRKSVEGNLFNQMLRHLIKKRQPSDS